MNDKEPPVRSSTSGGTGLRELARAVAGLSCDSAGERVVELARQRVFDALGAACLGFATPEGRALRALDAELASPGAPRHALDRCRLLAGAARTTEIDDIDVASCTTVGAVVVSAAVALAASRAHSSDRDLLAAVIAGYEAMMRLGRAIDGARVLYRGVWPTYATAAFGSAAAAAKLLGLDAARAGHALAIALARSGGLPAGSAARFGFRYYALGGAAAEGCAAALAAAAGVEAETEAEAEDLAAFAARIGVQVEESELAAAPGQPWLIGEVETKMLPSSRQALGSVAAFMLLDPSPERAAVLEHVVVYVPPAYRAMVDRPQPPERRIDSLLSVQYQIALAALDRDALYDALREPIRRDASIASLMAKIEVRPDDRLGELFPRHWGASLFLRWPDEELSCGLLDPPRAREPSWEDLQRKLERIFVASGLGRPRPLDTLLASCRSLGDGVGTGGAARLLGATDALLAEFGAAAEPGTAAGPGAGAGRGRASGGS